MHSSQTSERVAVIGLGAMGLPIAINLVKAGFDTEVWNRSPDAIARAVSAGAREINALDQCNSTVVLTVLPDINEVEEILSRGLHAALKTDAILVVMGTVSPNAVIELAKRLAVDGIHVVDAPMSGGDIGAQQASLSIMVGADPEIFDRLAPVFEAIGTTIRLLGLVGSGQVAKAANQIVVAATLAAIGEAITLARRSGLDPKTMLDILSGGLANSQALIIKREKIESGDFQPGGISRYQLKDLRIALEAASSQGLDFLVTDAVTRLYADLVDHGDGELDHSAIVREIERRSL